MSFFDLYKSRRVLVTGATGFKGSWLVFWLRQLGAEVLGIGLPPATQPNLYEQVGLGNLIDYREIDICETTGRLIQTIKDWHPDLIFHLAAQAIVRASYDDPVNTFLVNTLGTVKILDIARHIGCPVVAITSDKCYAPRDDLQKETYQEDARLGGHDPYSASKSCAELVAIAYRRSYGLVVATARAGNVIGPGDWAKDRIVPDIVRALVAGTSISIRNPYSIRPWQHVLEPLSGYLVLGSQLPVAAEAWNFGPNDGEHRVDELVDTFIANWGDGRWVYESRSFENKPENNILVLNIDKAVRHLSWQPIWTFNETIQHTVDGYRRFLVATDVTAARKILSDEIYSYTRTACERRVPWAT